MQVKRGIAASPGVAIGPALVLGSEDFRIPVRFVRVDVVDTEIARFRACLDAVCREIGDNETLANDRLGKQYGAIFGAHLQLVRDKKLQGEIETLIRERAYSPEFAASRVLRKYAREFQNLGNTYLAERAHDLFDIEKRLLRRLLGERREELSHLTAPVIILAHNLTPSETTNLNRDANEFVMGFATEVGGRTSHTAIIAGALEIPAVVGVGQFLSEVSGGETVIIDGQNGEVIIGPDDETLKRYREAQGRVKKVSERLKSLRRLRSQTKDGVRVSVMGNIEFPEEVEHCTERGADGIGLYRTEFLYLKTDREPTEEDHYQAYRKVITAFRKRPVVIRTLDLGADKVPEQHGRFLIHSSNPVLGLRSLRLSLQNLPLFKTQLRAILRAATTGNVRVMFPLVTSLLEFRQAKLVLKEVMEDLEEEGIPFKGDLPVGMMVEVPAAALLADEFAREVDFFSIGTNDLIQYTLAVDRADPAVANLYSSADPSVLRLIDLVLEAGRKHDVSVTVCGQISSDPKFIPLLVGMGLRSMSVTPHAIPEVKQVVRSLSIPQAEAIAQHVRTLDVARDVENYLRGELKKICPELVP